MVVKWCRVSPDVRCYKSSCSSLDSMGNVVVCRRVRDLDAFHTSRRVAPVHVSIFSKHLKSGRKVS
jgi:hypothetical protein